jgi:hypothetical protein
LFFKIYSYVNLSILVSPLGPSEPGIDPQALQVYNQIQSKIPNIAVKGTPEGNFSATTPNYPRTDPDCWWSFGKCTTPKLAGLVPDVSTCPQPNTFGKSRESFFSYPSLLSDRLAANHIT